MSTVSSLVAIRYEARIVGPWVFALPAFAACLFAIAAGMMAAKQAHQIDIQHMVMSGLEGGLPLVAGIGVATIAAHEPALEIQLTMSWPYRRVAFLRCGLLLALTACIESIAIFILARALPREFSQSGSAWLLAWVPTLLWFAGWGALLALLLRSRAASAAILGVVWVIELAFHGIFPQYGWTTPLYIFATMFSPDASFWLLNRLELLATGILLFGALWLFLGNAEWRLRGEE
jgi:hypothetical protein